MVDTVVGRHASGYGCPIAKEDRQMQQVFLTMAVLACPAGMGLMMWMMMRMSARHDAPDKPADAELDAARQIAQLRAEVDRLSDRRATPQS